MEDRRVVITRSGAITPVRNDIETIWSNIIKGNSGIDYITRVNKDDFPVSVAAEVKDFEPTQYIDKKDAKRMDRFTQSAVASAQKAVEDAKLDINDSIRHHGGVWIGA